MMSSISTVEIDEQVALLRGDVAGRVHAPRMLQAPSDAEQGQQDEGAKTVQWHDLSKACSRKR